MMHIGLEMDVMECTAISRASELAWEVMHAAEGELIVTRNDVAAYVQLRLRSMRPWLQSVMDKYGECLSPAQQQAIITAGVKSVKAEYKEGEVSHRRDARRNVRIIRDALEHVVERAAREWGEKSSAA